jgi:hypothetical protein
MTVPSQSLRDAVAPRHLQDPALFESKGVLVVIDLGMASL